MSSDVEFDPNDGTVINKIIKVNLKEFRVPSFVTRIKGGSSNTDSAFYPCASSIKNVTFEANSKITSLGDMLFSSSTLESIDMSPCVNLQSLSRGVFCRCSKLVNVILPPNLQKINRGSFSQCSLIEHIDIPDTVEVIEDYDGELSSVFSGCSRLKTIKISENSSLKYIGDHAFMSTGIKTIYIPKNTSSIGVGIFLCSSIETIIISPENKKFELMVLLFLLEI